MDLDFSDEQQMIADMTRAMLEEHSGVQIVRDMEDDPKGYPDTLWKQMSELGLNGLLIPESQGGGGQTLLEAVLVYEELGRAMAPTPHFASCVMSAGLLMAGGSDEQKDAWLGPIATGEAILTPAWLEPNRGFGEPGIALRAEADGGDFLLSGRKRLVAYASSATRLIVLARSDAGVDLFLVDPNSDGVTLKQLLSQGREAQYQIDFDRVRVSADDRIGAPGSGWTNWNEMMHQGIILLAATAIGGANRCLEETVEFSKQRIQFDKPLGAFQALAHYMADASTQIDGGRVLVHEAAWNHTAGRDIKRFAPMTKLFCCETYRETTRVCAQIWGGVAFTIEYDQQMFFRRAKQLQLSWWDTPYLEELIAADVLD
ncbi:MAG TPA: acyl-CoA dehydrogenase [Myxococcales bacterium]|nr:acyl-CoA dehydrogenase [Myxococcales bacterium]HIK86134.1 acyl-CoA dehydrogenase [Myxococcales bacterium]